MFQLQYADGQVCGRWGSKSELDTALAHSLADKPGSGKAQETDENNYVIVDKDGKTLFLVSGPRVNPESATPGGKHDPSSVA